MSRWISTHVELIPLYAQLSGYDPFAYNAQTIFEFDNGMPVAAAVFDQYNGQSVHTHIWVNQKRRPSRVWWWAIHDYVFNQLGCAQAIGIIKSTNQPAVKLARNMGFTKVAIISNYYTDGHALVYVGTEQSMTFWRRYRNGAPAPTYAVSRNVKKVES